VLGCCLMSSGGVLGIMSWSAAGAPLADAVPWLLYHGWVSLRMQARPACLFRLFVYLLGSCTFSELCASPHRYSYARSSCLGSSEDSINSLHFCSHHILVTTAMGQLLRLCERLAACFLLLAATVAKHTAVAPVTVGKCGGSASMTVNLVFVLMFCV